VNGYLDALPLPKVRSFEDALLANLRGPNVAILSDIRDSKDLSDATAAKLKDVVTQVQKQFL
jgi:F-type H+-transporting ATPase subunit alpha